MLLSLALAATKVCTTEEAVIGLLTARLEAVPVEPLRVTVLLLPEALPAASLARTK
ncbi:hypothetical protein SMICM17S_05593 [Streptomyces microflavus]